MQSRWTVALGAFALMSTFTMVASGRFLRQPAAEGDAAVARPPLQPWSSTQSPPATPTSAPPADLVGTNVHRAAARRAPVRPLDATDPWASSTVTSVSAPKRNAAVIERAEPEASSPRESALPSFPPRRAPLDADPWLGAPAPVAALPTAAPGPSKEALRDAIRWAVDHGDTELAAELRDKLSLAR
jgi:hypothetical protein